jgi:DNA polymerase-3 subunit alpha
MDDVPLDDPDVYRMLARGGTSGVFQFESNLATEKLRSMRCDRFEDLVATNALIRPGPLDSGMTDVYIRRKRGLESVTYPHPELEKTLAPTYGVIVYQEQVMRIANVLAGFSLAEADVLRKAVGKKDAVLIRKELEKFISQAVDRKIDRALAADLADQIETFGRYGFNKSHSAAYSLLSYHTAWLKAHYPAEFMAALLSSVLDKTDDVVKYIAECRDLHRHVPGLEAGIEVLPPDVTESDWKFSVTDRGQIRFGLGAVRGVGSGAVQSILAGRAEGGPFQHLFDFVARIDTRALNKRACEALIAAGALDAFGHRAQILAGLDAAYSEVQTREAEEAAGQASLFDGGGDTGLADRSTPTLPTVPEWSEPDRLAREKEALGFFISGHPLDRYRDAVRAMGPATAGTLGHHRGQEVEFGCVVTKVARQISRRDNSEWGRISVEDFYGTATVLAFRESWQQVRDTLTSDAVILLRGKVSDRERDEEDPPIFLDGVHLLEEVQRSGRLALVVEVLGGKVPPAQVFEAARDLAHKHPGRAPLELHVDLEDGIDGPLRLRSRTIRVDPSPEHITAWKELFGDARIRMVKA